MPIMIWLAIAVELGIQNWADAGILLGIQFVNATLSWYETTKAGDAVAALKASLRPQATVLRDGQWATLDATQLVPGDVVLLAAGNSVPADCMVSKGVIDVDQSALTGESLPVSVGCGSDIKMGSTVVSGEATSIVQATGHQTFFGKTAALLHASKFELGHLQKILLSIILTLVGLSCTLCFTAFGYLLGRGETFKEALSFTVVLLVASIPIAIEIVCTTTLALGSRQLSKMGAIVSRLAAIEDLAGMNMLCSDKTGTLTMNKMVIQPETPVFLPGEDQASVLRYAALACRWKEPPRDALDTLVLTSVNLAECDEYEQVEFMPFNPIHKRTESLIKAPEGSLFKVSKGAPHVIIALLESPVAMAAAEAAVKRLGQRGVRALAVARTFTATGPWRLVGLLTFLDPPRPDTKETIERALEYGADVKMITGDHVLIARETARMLGIGTRIQNASQLPKMDEHGKLPRGFAKTYGELIMWSDGFAQVLPDHKFMIVEALRQNGFAVGMTGDGVNDAPALKRADVGIAVQGATDAARAAADIVLTLPGLSAIVEAIIVARCIFQRMKNFVTYRIAATMQLLIFFFVAVLALHPTSYEPSATALANVNEFADWPPFFKMPVLLLMLITLLNDGTLISVAYDHVKPSRLPEKWNLKCLFLTSIVLGVVACGSSILLLWAALSSHEPNGLFARLGIAPLPYGKVTMAIYLKVSVSDFLTLFSARTSGFFWSSRPSLPLLLAALAALSLSTLLATLWPRGYLDGIPVEGLGRFDGNNNKLLPLWIWIYCIVWWFIQDTFKVVAIKLMRRYNVFDINTHRSVGVREVTHVCDSLSRASVGLTDTKLLQLRLDRVRTAVANCAARNNIGVDEDMPSTGSAVARRSSQDQIDSVGRGLQQVQNKMEALLRFAGTAGPAEGAPLRDVEEGAGGSGGGEGLASGITALQKELADIASAAQKLDVEGATEIHKQLQSVSKLAARLSSVLRTGTPTEGDEL